MALVNSEILALLDNMLKAFESKYNGNVNNPEFIGSIDETTYYNTWADYWRYVVGVNVVPMNTRFKTAHRDLDWKVFQHAPISEEQHEQWKSDKMFNDGMAIICGTVWHNPDKHGLQLNAIDADNLPAINEICNYKGKQFTVQDLAAWTLVEQHDDAPHKMHIVVYSTKPFLKKASNNNSPALKEGIKADEIPAIEVKSSDTAFLFVSGSPHEDGLPYKIVGTKTPAVCDDFENHIDNICRKYQIPYLDADNGNGSAQIPIEELFEEDFEIHENNNRHEALMRIMESLIKRNRKILPFDVIKNTLSREWNNQHCKPPLEDTEFEKQWKCAIEFIEERVQEETYFARKLRQKSEHEDDANNGNGAGGADNTQEEKLPDKEKEFLEERIKTAIEIYHDLDITLDPEAMIERFHIKTTAPDKEIFYFNTDRGIYAPDGNIVIEECLEYSSKKANEIYGLILEFMETLYADMPIRERNKMIEERLSDEGILKGEDWTRHSISEFLGHVERQTYFERKNLNPNIEWLACEDCMVNLLTGETAEFEPKYLNTTQIPVKYFVYKYNKSSFNAKSDPLVGCPKFLKFINEVVAPTDVELVLDFIAYCLWRDYKYHNWMLFNGEGQNGKSTLLYFIEKFLGKQNVSSESLQRILERNFSSAQLYGKLANIDADLSDEALSNTGLLKKLTGGDRLTVEHKHKPLFDFTNYAKLIFSANKMPENADRTTAFYRRLIIINFIRQFLGDDNNPNLKYEITTEEELSGFLRLMRERLPRVISEGIRATTNEEISRTQDQYEMSANPLKFFVDKALNPVPKNEAITPKTEMYDSYMRFCRHFRLPIESEQAFSRKLTKEYGFHYEQHRVDSEKIHCWDNVRLSDWIGVEDENQMTFEELEEERQSEKKEEQLQDDPNIA
jgi:P4 family phage/plasmid primase-like protien